MQFLIFFQVSVSLLILLQVQEQVFGDETTSSSQQLETYANEWNSDSIPNVVEIAGKSSDPRIRTKAIRLLEEKAIDSPIVKELLVERIKNDKSNSVKMASFAVALRNNIEIATVTEQISDTLDEVIELEASKTAWSQYLLWGGIVLCLVTVFVGFIAYRIWKLRLYPILILTILFAASSQFWQFGFGLLAYYMSGDPDDIWRFSGKGEWLSFWLSIAAMGIVFGMYYLDLWSQHPHLSFGPNENQDSPFSNRVNDFLKSEVSVENLTRRLIFDFIYSSRFPRKLDEQKELFFEVFWALLNDQTSLENAAKEIEGFFDGDILVQRLLAKGVLVACKTYIRPEAAIVK